MKPTFFLCFCLFLGAGHGLAQKTDLTEPLSNQSKGRQVFDPFLPGDTVWVFGDKVNVRSAPQKDAEIAFKLSIGDELVILDTAKSEQISGLDANWYHVRYPGKQTTGYIWGGLLSGNRYLIGDVYILCGFNYGKISATDKTDDLNVVFRAARNGQLLSAVAYDDVNYIDGPGMQTWQLPNMGIERFAGGVKTWIGYEACGYPQQDMYVFWDGRQLVKLPMLVSISDAGIFAHGESYIFPYAQYENSRPAQKIYFRVDHWEMPEDAEDDNVYDEWAKQRELIWNGHEYARPHISEGSN